MERIEKFRKNGYTTIHLFGNWYLVRKYSINYKRFSPWGLYHLTKD